MGFLYFDCCFVFWKPTALSFWVCCHSEAVLILRMSAHSECVLILSVFSVWVCSHFECVLILNAFSFWVCSHYECACILTVSQDPTRALLDLIPHSSKRKISWRKSVRKGMSVNSKTYEGLCRLSKGLWLYFSPCLAGKVARSWCCGRPIVLD